MRSEVRRQRASDWPGKPPERALSYRWKIEGAKNMADETIIAWTDHTFNPWWGCVKVSPGCAHCYAEALSKRYGNDVWGGKADRRFFGAKHWAKPLQWNREAQQAGQIHRVFCASMADVFEDRADLAPERARLWEVIRETPSLHWQILTKRPENIEKLLPADWPLQNVWLGTSIESMDYAWRADALRKIPAAVRFISYEPALGPLDGLDLTGIDWVICGGESGNGFRPMDMDWARNMRDKCKAAGVSFFFKQSSHRFTERGIELDGKIIREYPAPRKIKP
ncbi:MAG: DUF5131 family protein [Phycisphaerae bacterium]